MPVKAPDIPQFFSRGHTITQVESKASNLLRNTPYPSLGKLDCRFRNGILTLHGHVESFFLKQVAQERLLRNLDPSIRILNDVEVA